MACIRITLRAENSRYGVRNDRPENGARIEKVTSRPIAIGDSR